jgi:hypothetical protein
MALIILTEVKEHLRFTGDDATTDFDTILNQLILQIDKAVKTYLNRDIEQTTYKQLYNGTGDFFLELNQYPIISVSALSQSLDRTTQKYSDKLTEGTQFLLNKKSGIIELFENTFSRDQKNVYIEYSAGFTSVPGDIKLVCLDWIYKKFEDLQNRRIGLTVKNVMSENVSYIINDLNREDLKTLSFYRKKDRISNGVDVTGWSESS